MSITKKLLPLSMVASILLTACGGGGNSENTPSQNNNNTVLVPQKISIDIPNALKNKRTTNLTQEKILNDDIQENQNVQSFGYQQLTNTISQAEGTINSVKENMKYLTLMMPDIVNACEDTVLNRKCTIPAGEIKLTVEGQTLSIGEIFYTKQDENKKYQQVVVLDLKPTLLAMGQLSIEKDLETVKWSTDENHIETSSDVKRGEDTFNMHLIYDKESNGESTMTITDKYDFDDMKGNFTLKLNDKNDANNTVIVETTATNKFQDESDSFSSKGFVDDNGGYLVSKGSYFDSNYAEKETFDATGSLLKSSFCHTGDTCDMNDSNTWINFDFEEGFVDDFDNDSFPEEIDVDFQEPLELTFTQSENFPQYTYCEILPSDYNGSLNEDDVYEKSIGSFAKFDDELFGVLFDISEKNNINHLSVLCNSSETTKFSQLADKKRPIFGVKE